MVNIAIVGVGGQGSVLAAKLLATMAHRAGRTVRTAETIGMAQRGGSVVSHVRIGGAGLSSDAVASPLIPPASASVMIAFEPGEALRALSLLAPDGTVITASTPLAPAQADGRTYARTRIIDELAARVPSLIVVDDERVLAEIGNRRCLNTVLLASAVAADLLPFTVEELREAVSETVRPRFEALNQQAITVALGGLEG